jgi:hypothetical protein
MLTRQTAAYCTVTYAHANLVFLLGTVSAARASSRSARASRRRGGILRMRSLSRRRSNDMEEVKSRCTLDDLTFFSLLSILVLQ